MQRARSDALMMPNPFTASLADGSAWWTVPRVAPDANWNYAAIPLLLLPDRIGSAWFNVGCISFLPTRTVLGTSGNG